MRSYTGSASIYYYQDSSGSGSGQLTTLINEVIKGGTGAGDSVNADSSYVKFKLRIKDGTANGRFIEFTAIPTSISMTSAIGEVVSADISFEAHGAPSGLVL